MNKKYIFMAVFLLTVIALVHATPDRRRYVLDNLIGLNGKNIIVHQMVYDNLQTHYNHIFEEYLIEKHMENGKTVIVKIIKITEENKIEKLLLQEYDGNINRIFPDIMFDKQSIFNNGYIEIPGELKRRYYLNDHIPGELINCTIVRIVDVYFIGDYIYLTIDLRDDINIYRKVIMIKYQ